MSKKKASKQGKKKDNDFEFWNDIALAVQSVSIKVGEFEEKLNTVEEKLDKVLLLVKNNPSIEKNVDDKVDDTEEEDRKPKAIEKRAKKRRNIYR